MKTWIILALVAGGTANAQFLDSSTFQKQEAAPVRPATPSLRPVPIAPTGVTKQPEPKGPQATQPPPATQDSVATRFQCGKKRATTLADAAALYKEVLGIDGVRPGRMFKELPGFGSVLVNLYIKNTENFQLHMVWRGDRGTLPVSLCARGGQLIAYADSSDLGQVVITISNPDNSPNRIHMRAKGGDSDQVINHYYKLQDGQGAR